jgi:hypothetical protein
MREPTLGGQTGADHGLHTIEASGGPQATQTRSPSPSAVVLGTEDLPFLLERGKVTVDTSRGFETIDARGWTSFVYVCKHMITKKFGFF